MVCGPCSNKRWLLPEQSSKPLRVCLSCYDKLSVQSNAAPVAAARGGGGGESRAWSSILAHTCPEFSGCGIQLGFHPVIWEYVTGLDMLDSIISNPKIKIWWEIFNRSSYPAAALYLSLYTWVAIVAVVPELSKLKTSCSLWEETVANLKKYGILSELLNGLA